jgi:hypothetical protein
VSLSGQVGTLATRIGTEFKTIRSTFVPNSLRGPIGGITASTGVTGTVTIDPTLSNHRRLTATGDVTIGLMAAGTDGQRVLFEVNASGGQRVVTFDPGYELSAAVPTRAFTVPSGTWAYIAVIYRGTTWRLTSAEPQAVPDYSTPSAWTPADHQMQAWSYDPLFTAGAYVPAANGQMFGTSLKVTNTCTVSSIYYATTTNGSGFTSGRNLIGLYNTAGTLLAQTADMSASWGTAGRFNTAFTASAALSPGIYFVNFLVTATTPPSIAATALPTLNALAAGRTGVSYRGYWYLNVVTTLPNPRTTPSGPDRPMWVGLA